ncbi:MAG: hypothetical protein ACJ74Q_10435 [Pyrinomonadaceae bacterium]
MKKGKEKVGRSLSSVAKAGKAKPEKVSHTHPIVRSLVSEIGLSIGPDEVKLSLVFGSVVEAEDNQPLVERLDSPWSYPILTIPRSVFTDEEQINRWADSVRAVYTEDLSYSLIMMMRLELTAAARIGLKMSKVSGHSPEEILKDITGEYGKHLRRALVMRGAHNETPFNNETLTIVLRAAINELLPKTKLKRLTLGGLYHEIHLHIYYHPDRYPAEAFPPTSDALRKLCDDVGINLERLVDSVIQGEE